MKITSWISCLLVLSMLMLSSCSDTGTGPDDDGDNGDPESPTLSADLSYSPENPEIGTEVTLDASGSDDDQGIGYEVAWSIDSKPTDSEAIIDAPTQSQTSFTPDVAGDYVITVTVSNDSEGISDSEQTTISAVDASQTQEISGNIDSDRTLENLNEDPSIPDYLVTGNLNINAVLTIEPGVLLEVQENVLVYVSSSGTLIAEGTQADSIKFTSSNVEGQLHWKGILVRSSTSQNSMKFVEIAYAGNEEHDLAGYNFRAGVAVDENGKLSVQNSAFKNNLGYGLFVDEEGELHNSSENHYEANEYAAAAPAREIDDFDSNSSFAGNTEADVVILSSTYPSDKESTWNALSGGASYNVVGNLTIDGVLTIDEGTSFAMNENVMWTIDGVLKAQGTQSQNVEFTTAFPNSPLYWKGLHFRSSDSRNALDYTSLSYAGNEAINFAGDNFPAIIGVEEDAKLAITNSSFSNSLGYGVFVDEQGTLTDFAANSFSENERGVAVPADEVDDIDSNTSFSNNSSADVEILSTTYSDTKQSTWQPLNGSATYRVTGYLDIDGALSIAAGAHFELDENVLVTVDGSLEANGSSGNEIVFTSSNQQGGQLWKGIYFRSSSSLNSLNGVKVSYAGNEPIDFAGDNYEAGVGVGEQAKLSVSNSELSNNQGYGLYVDEAGIIELFDTNVVTNNDYGVGLPADEADDMDYASSFSANNQGDVIIFPTTLSEQKDVTWSGLSGGAAYRVIGNLYIDGVLTLGGNSHFENDQDVQWVVDGVLRATGEPGEEVVLTSSNIQGGIHWQGLYYRSSDTRNMLNYAEVSYAGSVAHDFSGENFKANVGINTGAYLDIDNSVISNSAGYGVYSKGTINNIESSAANNTFTNNISGNVF